MEFRSDPWEVSGKDAPFSDKKVTSALREAELKLLSMRLLNEIVYELKDKGMGIIREDDGLRLINDEDVDED